MAVLRYGHFDATEDDERLLYAADLAWYNHLWLTDGIRNGGDCLQVSAGGGMSVNINKGMAHIQGRMFGVFEDYNGLSVNLTVQPAHNQYPRTDRVILRMSLDPDINGIVPMVLMGTAGSQPVAPGISRSADRYDLSLARVSIPANPAAVTAGNITDERLNTDVCGISNSACHDIQRVA
jgi:hypothetical protein